MAEKIGKSVGVGVGVRQGSAVPAQPIPVFADEVYGVLLVPTADSPLSAILASDLLAQLAASGVTEQVAVQLYAEADPPSLAYLRRVSRAKLVAQMSIGEDETTPVVGWQFAAERPSPGLNAIMAALSAPLPASAASHVSARRLAVIINADLGYVALHEGVHEECAQRFTAVLAQDAHLQTDFTRAEASHVSLAVCLDALGQAEAARTHYEAAIALNPEFAQGHFGLGNY
jgi:tetratricopeptide (TPR) repeat protein